MGEIWEEILRLNMGVNIELMTELGLKMGG